MCDMIIYLEIIYGRTRYNYNAIHAACILSDEIHECFEKIFRDLHALYVNCTLGRDMTNFSMALMVKTCSCFTLYSLYMSFVCRLTIVLGFA